MNFPMRYWFVPRELIFLVKLALVGFLIGTHDADTLVGGEGNDWLDGMATNDGKWKIAA